MTTANLSPPDRVPTMQRWSGRARPTSRRSADCRMATGRPPDRTGLSAQRPIVRAKMCSSVRAKSAMRCPKRLPEPSTMRPGGRKARRRRLPAPLRSRQTAAHLPLPPKTRLPKRPTAPGLPPDVVRKPTAILSSRRSRSPSLLPLPIATRCARRTSSFRPYADRTRSASLSHRGIRWSLYST